MSPLFSQLVAGMSIAALCQYLCVSERTIYRCKSGAQPIPAPVQKLCALRNGDAAALLGKDWEGFRFGTDGLLYIPGWRHGFDPHEIKAMFFRVQLVRHHEATIRQQEKRITALEAELARALNSAAEYRRIAHQSAAEFLIIKPTD